MPPSGHQLTGTFESPIPLPVYLAGAAAAVALSFAVVFLRDVPSFGSAEERVRTVPRWLRAGLRALGLVAVAWLLAQAVVGGTSEADVSGLFLWTYGWVGLALVSALVGPAWSWLDPFSAVHDIGAAILRRAGIRGWTAATYPARLGRWPAVAGFAAIIWLELVVTGGAGGRTLVAGFAAYAAITLIGMAQYGRDTWRANGEVFTVWFGLLGRIAPFALAGPPEAGLVRRRPYGAGLLDRGWSAADVALAAIAVISVLYDGLSQTQPWFDLVGLPGLVGTTLILAVFLGGGAALALGVARLVGAPPLARPRGSPPSGRGSSRSRPATWPATTSRRSSSTASGSRSPSRIPSSRAGTCSGRRSSSRCRRSSCRAWSGRSSSGPSSAATCSVRSPATWPPSRGDRRRRSRPPQLRAVRLRQLPLAVLMVGLTMATLWSLGQALVVEPPA